MKFKYSVLNGFVRPEKHFLQVLYLLATIQSIEQFLDKIL